jgi:hypothetical protein
MKKTLCMLLPVLLAPAIFAGTRTFDFAFGNDPYGGMATGQFTIDSGILTTILSDTADDPYPMSDFESFSITVSGARAGNGTFGLSDFSHFLWWSAGASFNFQENLVGQPTTAAPPFNPWGTPALNSGDFNFFNASASPLAPTGEFFFGIQTNGGNVGGPTGDPMALTSLQEVVASPEPASILLFGAALLGLTILPSRRQHPLTIRKPGTTALRSEGFVNDLPVQSSGPPPANP